MKPTIVNRFVFAAFAVILLLGLSQASAQTPGPTAQGPEETIDLGAPPLTNNEMSHVMNWIAVRVGALRLPFCWKQSEGRGAGEPYICREGLDRNGLLCYPKCKAGLVGNGPVCWGTCPAGFTDVGAFCQKPAAYTREGFGWRVGDPLLPNYSGPIGRCEAKYGKTACEQSGAVIYPKCKPGFHAVGCCTCSPDCPAGWADTGTGCTKPKEGRGAGEPLAMGVCAPGLEKDPKGALCYPPCKGPFTGVGPVCWQNCPSQHPWDCGAGCSTDQKQCATAVVNMVISPIMAAVSLATFGAGSAATGGANAAAKAAQAAASGNKLILAKNTITAALTAAKGNVATLVGGAQKLAKIQNVAKIGGKIYVASSAVGKQVDLFSKEFADNFDVLTSPEIAREIDQRFGKEAAYQIKREWGVRHLTLMLEADGFKTANNVISLLSVADPTGLSSVVNAFMHPICKNDTPFPKVNPLYNH
jgi:hypothetical protein